MFSVDQRDAINVRRAAQWSGSIAAPAKQQHLKLLIAEVKELVPARFGFKAVVKHLPDHGFALDQQLYRRLGRRFKSELALWGASDDIHMVLIATFGVSAVGVPSILELSLMPVTRQWLPVEDTLEKQLVEQLLDEERSFVKGLRYDLSPDRLLASATLTDCAGVAPMLYVVPQTVSDNNQHLQAVDPSASAWAWHPQSEAMPPLPRCDGGTDATTWRRETAGSSA